MMSKIFFRHVADFRQKGAFYTLGSDGHAPLNTRATRHHHTEPPSWTALSTSKARPGRTPRTSCSLAFRYGPRDDRAFTHRGSPRDFLRAHPPAPFRRIDRQAKYGNRWASVAEEMPGRTGQQCAQRWRHKVNPTIRKDKWTDAEDAMVRAVPRPL
jgi:hypothetical protein